MDGCDFQVMQTFLMSNFPVVQKPNKMRKLFELVNCHQFQWHTFRIFHFGKLKFRAIFQMTSYINECYTFMNDGILYLFSSL